MTIMKHHRKKFNSYPAADQKNAFYAVYNNKPHFRDGSFKKNTIEEFTLSRKLPACLI